MEGLIFQSSEFGTDEIYANMEEYIMQITRDNYLQYAQMVQQMFGKKASSNDPLAQCDYGNFSLRFKPVDINFTKPNWDTTTVSELLGEPVAESTTDDLKILSEKLEVINLQLAKRSITKVKTIRWILISLCAVIVVIFIALASTNSFYLNWNYNDPELAVAGTILHGFEFLFVRLAPIVFLTSVVGVVVTYKKR